MSPDKLPIILSVNASVIGGGAERVALSLHEEYLARGLDAWLAVGCLNGDAPRAFEIPLGRQNALTRVLRRAAAGLASSSRSRQDLAWYTSRLVRLVAEPIRYARVLRGFEDFDFPRTRQLLDLAPERPDVLHLHNLHGGYFDIRSLPDLTSMVPTVLTLHDTWLLTGHCANPLTCERWRFGCADCPFLDLYVPLYRDESAANRRVKREALLKSRLGLAVPSKWMLGMVEAGGILGGSLEARIVPNGVDTTVFRPRDRVEARAALDLPADRRIVTFAARSVTDNPFKDFRTLEKALALLSSAPDTSDLLFVALGASSSATRISGIEARCVPFVADPAQVALHFQSTDVYVHPTRAESFGLVIAEAMACGAPVVATRAGAVPELVVDGETGLLVGEGDAESLAVAIASLLSDPARRMAFGKAGAARVAGRFSLSHEADVYLAWYEELLAERRGGETP